MDESAAKSKFFASMERELLDSFEGPPSSLLSARNDDGGGGLDDDIDFSMTESGRTVAHSGGSGGQQEDFSLTKSSMNELDTLIEESTTGPSSGSGSGSSRPPPASSIPIPQPVQSQQLLYAGGGGGGVPSQPSSHGSTGSAFLSSVLNPNASSLQPSQQQQILQQQQQQQSQLLSHTPPTGMGTSYEASHFGKRARSGSVSGRLRSASEYLEDKGLLDRQTKSLLKDLIIIGDEELQRALDRYETAGDASALEEMISSGALQARLPADLDLMNDLDLDFLTVTDADVGGVDPSSNIEAILPAAAAAAHQEPEEAHAHQQQQRLTAAGEPLGVRPQLLGPSQVTTHQHQQRHGQAAPIPQTTTPTNRQHQQQPPPMSVTPQYDDGIGDLDFSDMVGSDDNVTDYVPQQQQHTMYREGGGGGGGGKHASSSSAGGSPATASTTLSDYERRMRSNSLFSALLLEPQMQRSREDSLSLPGSVGGDGGGGPHSDPNRSTAGGNTTVMATDANTGAQPPDGGYNDWMQQYLEPIPPASGAAAGQQQQQATASMMQGGIQITRPRGTASRRSTLPATGVSGGIGASLVQAESNSGKKKQGGTKKGRKEKQKLKKEVTKSKSDEEMEEQHVPGSGRPRALSDPNLRTSSDDLGLRQVDRPDGWVGAYSPESRTVRIERFMQKRNHRVWSKTIKYDVRKNFADSRLRVKGRFVRKEDELLMRELMSLT